MDQKQRCQSCGMPLGNGFFGTEIDGSGSSEYCKFCYQKGMFTEPDLTMDEMIAMSVKNMTEDLHFPKEKAERLANDFIPQLKRWQQNSH